MGLGDFGHEDGPARANSGGDTVRRLRVEAVSRPDLVDERFLGGIDVRAGDPAGGAIFQDEVDGTEIAEHGDRQADEPRERSLVVERRVEQRAHVRQHGRSPLQRESRPLHTCEHRQGERKTEPLLSRPHRNELTLR